MQNQQPEPEYIPYNVTKNTFLDEKLVSSVQKTIDMVKVKISELEALGKKGIFMPTGPQAIGKSTFCEKIVNWMRTNGWKIKVVSADDIMGVVFKPERIVECHQECQRLCLKYSQAGYHIIVDNTSMKRPDCSIYQSIAQATNAVIVPFILGPEFWLNATIKTRKEFIDILDSRCQIRELKTGKAIDISVIEKTIDNALNDFKTVTGKQAQDITTMEDINAWLNYFPIPHYKEGFVDDRGTLMWRSSMLTKCCTKSLEDFKVIRSNVDIDRVKCMIMRGINEFHITVFTPKEVKYLKSIVPLDEDEAYCDVDVCCEWANVKMKHDDIDEHYCKKCSPIEIDLTGQENAFQAIKSTLQKEPTTPTYLGVGRASMDGHGEVLFEVVQWDRLNEIRYSVDLDDKDFHATLAWTGENDIHGVSKGKDTLIT